MMVFDEASTVVLNDCANSNEALNVMTDSASSIGVNKEAQWWKNCSTVLEQSFVLLAIVVLGTDHDTSGLSVLPFLRR